MTVILGIDPGSRKTGFGVISVSGARINYITSGIIRLPEGPLPERLKVIHGSVCEIIENHAPQIMAVEEVFFARDPRAALKLGQARGAAIVAGVCAGLEVAEYSPRTIKQAVVGSGAATKAQVQHMVTRLLKLPAEPKEDAADGLAAAICHAHNLRMTSSLSGSRLSSTLSSGKARYSRGRIK